MQVHHAAVTEALRPKPKAKEKKQKKPKVGHLPVVY